TAGQCAAPVGIDVYSPAGQWTIVSVFRPITVEVLKHGAADAGVRSDSYPVALPVFSAIRGKSVCRIATPYELVAWDLCGEVDSVTVVVNVKRAAGDGVVLLSWGQARRVFARIQHAIVIGIFEDHDAAHVGAAETSTGV